MSEDQETIEVRQATGENDLPYLLEMEQEWIPTQRATAEQLAARLEIFAEGTLLAFIDDQVVATLTSVPIEYNPDEVYKYSTWAEVSNDGMMHWPPIGNPNALYVISGVVREGYHDRQLFEIVINRICDIAAEMGYSYVLAGARLPAYKRYIEKRGEISAADYALKKLGKHYIDPLIEKYRRIGFSVPGPDHVKTGYYPDESSLDHAAIVVRKVD
ncbi:MAG: hypothetical protein GY753_15320 [Gammaproteobacteria bacterium]|nr:hypothetical protein [Gammaproteobacteria bacterium]